MTLKDKINKSKLFRLIGLSTVHIQKRNEAYCGEEPYAGTTVDSEKIILNNLCKNCIKEI